jgi:hypothetical protein
MIPMDKTNRSPASVPPMSALPPAANGPADPMTPAAEGLATIHEMYKGMREAGFTLIEATAIIGAMLAHGASTGEGGSTPS